MMTGALIVLLIVSTLFWLSCNELQTSLVNEEYREVSRYLTTTIFLAFIVFIYWGAMLAIAPMVIRGWIGIATIIAFIYVAVRSEFGKDLTTS